MTKTYKRSPQNPGSIVNTDLKGLEAYKKRKKLFSNMLNIDERIVNLENKLDKILELLEKNK